MSRPSARPFELVLDTLTAFSLSEQSRLTTLLETYVLIIDERILAIAVIVVRAAFSTSSA